MAYGDLKDLTSRTISDKVLCDKAFDIAKSPKYDGYLRFCFNGLLQIFDKKTSGSATKNENISNKN